MELFDNEPEENQNDAPVEIFSKKAILVFSIFMPLYGALLLVQNLWTVGYKKAIAPVLIFTVAYSYFIIPELTQLLPFKVNLANPSDPKNLAPSLILSVVGILANLSAGLILSQVFFKRYFPEDDYYPKPVGRAVIRLIMLIFIFVFLSMRLGLRMA